jgi:hypothetical protein
MKYKVNYKEVITTSDYYEKLNFILSLHAELIYYLKSFVQSGIIIGCDEVN